MYKKVIKTMSRKNSLVLLSISTVVLFLNFFCIPVHSWEIDNTGIATNIVDGDTFDVDSIGRIRLADIDCPEPGEPGCETASNYLEFLIYEKEVYIDEDDITGTDPYGRMVAVVYVYHNESHLKNVNKALLVAGHAVIWDFDNNEFNPYEWTLYVEYPTSPPSEDDSSNEEDTNKQWNPAFVVPLVFGVSAIGISAIAGIYAYYNLAIFKKRPKEKKLKPKERYDIAKQTIEKRMESTDEEILIEKPKEKDLVTTPNEDKIMIKDITSKMDNVNIDGKIKEIKMPHKFTRKDGSIGKVGSFIMKDGTGSIRVVLWDNNCCLLENDDFVVGKYVKIKSGYSKLNTFYGKDKIEIYLGKYSKLELENSE